MQRSTLEAEINCDLSTTAFKLEINFNIHTYMQHSSVLTFLHDFSLLYQNKIYLWASVLQKKKPTHSVHVMGNKKGL